MADDAPRPRRHALVPRGGRVRRPFDVRYGRDRSPRDARAPPAAAPRSTIAAQCSAHGSPRPSRIESVGDDRAVVRFERRERRVARGQSVVVYEGDEVIGGGIAT